MDSKRHERGSEATLHDFALVTTYLPVVGLTLRAALLVGILSNFHCAGQNCSRRQLMQEMNADPAPGSGCSEAALPKAGTQYLLTLMPVMQAHAHMQAAALRLFPGRKLLCPTTSVHQILSIRSWSSKETGANNEPKFDLAQIWSLHSPSSYASQYGFRRALLGEPQERPVSELCRDKYKSLSFFTHDQLSRPSVAMTAEDIIKFLLSDFARKGQYDEIFDRSETVDTAIERCVKPLRSHEMRDVIAQEAVPTALAPAPCTSPATAMRVFTSACVERMRELEEHMHAGAHLFEVHGEDADTRSIKRRRLAFEAAGSIARVLFDANKLVLDAAINDKTHGA
jgi:hypothetical protein